jgi:hypothetical protein
MAKATRSTTRVPKPIEFVKNVDIVLTLSLREAETLRDICSRIGGDPNTSRRRLTDSIGRALSSAGVDYTFAPGDLEPRGRNLGNNIYFHDD